MLVSDVLKQGGRHKRAKRVGRGIGSGHGKTSGRGTKGLLSRTGGKTRLLSEGGQMPLFRRLPKRGFSNAQFRVEYQVVNVEALNRFEDGTKVTPASLAAAGLIGQASKPVKVLGTGQLTRRLDVEANRFSAAAAEKITAAGGQVRRIG